MASGNKYTHSTFFYTTDNVYYAGDLTRDMVLALDFAAFRAPRVEVQARPLSLNGGIAAVDLIASMVSTDINLPLVVAILAFLLAFGLPHIRAERARGTF